MIKTLTRDQLIFFTHATADDRTAIAWLAAVKHIQFAFDERSFRLKDEVNLNIYDAEFAAAQVKVFEQDLRRSRRVTRGELDGRSGVSKLCDRLALTLRRQL